jgi:asparagine synthetase B (glutamine-hydrolysing)
MHRDYVRAARLERRRRRRRSPPGLSIGNEYFWERIRTSSHLASIDLYQRSAQCEYRSPLLYLPLVRFMMAVPWTQKFGPARDRCLQRDALRGILPDEIRRRRGKSGSTQSLFDGLNQNPDWVDFLTSRCQLAERGYVDAERWRLAVMHARYGQSACPPHFMTACILEAWFKTLSDAPKSGSIAIQAASP